MPFGWGSLKVIVGKDSDEKKEEKKATKEVETVVKTFIDYRQLKERKKGLDTFHWGQTNKEGTAPDGPFLFFREILKFTNGFYGWPQETVLAFSSWIEGWQDAIDDEAQESAREYQAQSRRLAALYMGTCITPEDKHGDFGFIPYLPKPGGNREDQKLIGG
jgi:hypothetical protein